MTTIALGKPNIVLIVVAAHFGVATTAILSASRVENIAWARHTAVYVLRHACDESRQAISRLLNRNPHTIDNSLRAVCDRMDVDRKYATTVNELLNMV